MPDPMMLSISRVARALESCSAVHAVTGILMKLLGRRDTQSAKQWENALGVARVQQNRLDWHYLRHWAHQLGIEADLDRLAREAGI